MGKKRARKSLEHEPVSPEIDDSETSAKRTRASSKKASTPRKKESPSKRRRSKGSVDTVEQPSADSLPRSSLGNKRKQAESPSTSSAQNESEPEKLVITIKTEKGRTISFKQTCNLQSLVNKVLKDDSKKTPDESEHDDIIMIESSSSSSQGSHSTKDSENEQQADEIAEPQAKKSSSIVFDLVPSDTNPNKYEAKQK